MALDVVVIDPVRETVPAEWPELVRAAGLPAIWHDDLLVRLAWFARQPAYMALVTDGGTPCALFHARHRGARPPRRFRGTSPRLLPGLVECHLAPYVTTPGYAFHPESGTAERAAAVKAFERGMAHRLGLRCAGVVYRQVIDEDRPIFRGHVIRPGEPEAVVDNRWGGVEEYLRDLPGDDRRHMRRVERLVSEDPGVRAAVETSIDGADAGRLLSVVQHRYRGRFTVPVPVPALYFEMLSGRPGIRFLTYRRPDGELLAYALQVDDGRTLLCQGWGTRDRSDGGRPHLYFDHFLRQVYQLIEDGREKMIMGKSMYELKRRFGARLSPLYAAATLR
ncbi:GNAT family N-acetyltransferase [Actinoallomurus sp. NPDC050550]|uniref:GNAT family N-acetyltransferase n=1 Tax=Actinoallomurus sp. NPDC050550 TaxID=3154937 RepID=UPI0033EFB64C